MNLLSAASLALALSLGFAPEADAQYSRKDYPQDRQQTSASAKTPARTAETSSRSRKSNRPAPRTTPPRSTANADRASAPSRTSPRATAPRSTERPRGERAEPRPRNTTAPRSTPRPDGNRADRRDNRTPVYCPPAPRPTRVSYGTPRRTTTRVTYRDYGPVDYGTRLSRGERRAYQQELERRAERLANWDIELVERAARRTGRDPYLSPRERRELAVRYFPYSTAGLLPERDLRDWDGFLAGEAAFLSDREERLRRGDRRNRRVRTRDNRGNRSCPPGGW